jgi:hypothetical protein
VKGIRLDNHRGCAPENFDYQLDRAAQAPGVSSPINFKKLIDLRNDTDG